MISYTKLQNNLKTKKMFNLNDFKMIFDKIFKKVRILHSDISVILPITVQA